MALGALVAASATSAAGGQGTEGAETWTGGSATSLLWSDPANWSPATAPSGDEPLIFPALSSGAAAGSSQNDVSGLSPSSLSIATGSSTSAYALDGSPLSLGAGGLTSTDPSASGSAVPNEVDLPIVLGANQTWSVTGVGPAMFGGVSGSSSSLTIDLAKATNGTASTAGVLGLGGDVEVGSLSIVGADPAAVGGSAGVENGSVVMLDTAGLNGSDDEPVSVTDAALFAAGNVGPLTVRGGGLFVGTSGTTGTSSPGSLAAHVVGAATLDDNSMLAFPGIEGAEDAGATYPQLTASGTVTLGGAQLALLVGCTSRLAPGDELTLVKAAAIEGTFDDGSTNAPLREVTERTPSTCPGGARAVSFRLRYGPTSVTATVLTGLGGGGSSSGAGASAPRLTRVGKTATMTPARLELLVGCGLAVACAGTATVEADEGSGPAVPVAHGAFSIPRGHARLIKLRLTPAGRRLLARLGGRHKATIVTIDLRGGGASRHVVVV